MGRRAAVITASGFGDGLMMMVASETLRKKGYEVTTFNPHLYTMLEWFPGHDLVPIPHTADLVAYLETFDLIVLQNDNSKKSKAIIKAFQQGKIRALSIFYPSHEAGKHPPLTGWDHLFDPTTPMVESIAKATSRLLDLDDISFENGLKPLPYLTRGRYTSRIVIHPTSTTPLRTYSKRKFIKIARKLISQGHQVGFTVSPAEWVYWQRYRSLGIDIPFFESLSGVAAYVYESALMIGNESGISHLASNLGLKTIVIAGNARRIKQWRPGWRKGEVITPPPWVPNIKGLRLRENRWQHFISTKHILNHCV